jgi:hypothetical protein
MDYLNSIFLLKYHSLSYMLSFKLNDSRRYIFTATAFSFPPLSFVTTIKYMPS